MFFLATSSSAVQYFPTGIHLEITWKLEPIGKLDCLPSFELLGRETSEEY